VGACWCVRTDLRRRPHLRPSPWGCWRSHWWGHWKSRWGRCWGRRRRRSDRTPHGGQRSTWAAGDAKWRCSRQIWPGFDHRFQNSERDHGRHGHWGCAASERSRPGDLRPRRALERVLSGVHRRWPRDNHCWRRTSAPVRAPVAPAPTQHERTTLRMEL
jgi:hypothetical protein